MDFGLYRWIVISISGGKDSQAMLSVVAMLVANQSPRLLRRVVVVHADLGRAEWEGTKELAELHAKAYGFRYIVVARKEDLLQHVLKRGKWPSSAARYCTSDHKRDQIAKVYTLLANEARVEDDWDGKPVQILNCMGFRAEESPARAKRPVLELNARVSSSRKQVTDWLPIHDWTEARVWSAIKSTSIPHHPAYDLGMPRLSCAFCIFAPREALLIAGKANRGLLREYVRIEKKIGHQFRGAPGKSGSLALAEIEQALDEGKAFGPVTGWGNQ